MKTISLFLKVHLFLVFIFLISSCKKEETLNVTKQDVSAPQTTATQTLAPQYDDLVGTGEIWGVGIDKPYGRVYKYYLTGGYWTEPNPGAALTQISVGKSGGVFGLGANGRIYAYNGTNWTEPNPSYNLLKVSNISSAEAYGIGLAGVYYTSNGGVSWTIDTRYRFAQISAGNFDNVWAITANNIVFKFDVYTKTWAPAQSNKLFKSIDADRVFGYAYGLDVNDKIYRTTDNGATWTAPKPNAIAYNISGSDNNVWALGANNRIFKSVDGAVSWSEPNPGAQVVQIAYGF